MSFPILYPKGTSEPSGVGIGVLTDALEVKVTREINGAYELTMRYPVEGIHFGSIGLESVIAAKVPDKENYQLFKIYSISEPIDLSVTIDAEHVSYMTGDIPLQPFTNQVGGIDGILDAMNTIGVPNGIHSPFTFTDTLPRDATIFTLKEPTSMREVMGDSDGMLLSKDFYEKAEWDIDNYNLCLTPGLGTDKRYVHYVYGKNVSDINQDSNLTNMVTGIFPYVHAETDEGKPINVLGDICYGAGHENFVHERIVATNVESYFTDEEKEAWSKYGDTDIKMPTKQQVNSKATEAIKDFDFMCKPEITISVSPVDLTGVSGYETVAESLKQIQLGDTITVIFSEYGIEKEARVIKVTYNVLDGCNENIEVGDPSPNLAATLAAIGEKTEVNRAGIVVGKDSILAYVDRTDGRMGSQLRMTEDEIKSTVAAYSSSWNMVPLTGSANIYGEGWRIEIYSYGTPDANKKNAEEFANYNYFDEETGYTWESVQVAGTWIWRRKRFARRHDFRWYDETGSHTATANPGDESWTTRLDGYCESNITQLGYQITQEVSNRASGDQSIIDQTPSQISLRVTSPSDMYGERRAGITITTQYGDGSERQAAGVIEFEGTCVFKSNLEDNDGTTTINGANIRTGIINANRIDVNNLIAKQIETNGDGNGYRFVMRNGVIRVYDSSGINQRSSTGMYYAPFRVSSSGDITFGWTYYYGICINDASGNGLTWFLFGEEANIIRLRRADGNLIPPASVILGGISAICEWLDLRILLGMSYSDIKDTGSTDYTVINTKQLKAIWNNTTRRIQFKNANTSSLDPDNMAATVNYVKYYVDGGEGSDRRWKNSVTDLEDVSNTYMQFRPVSFKYNEGIDEQHKDDEIRFGLIAQEVSEIYPESMYHMVNHVVPDEDDVTPGIGRYTPSEYYRIRYEELHALHISMIQKHEKEIQELKEQIKLLQNKED